MSAERRRSRRVETSGVAVLQGDPGRLEGQLRDLSVDAALMEVPGTWAVGTAVEIELTLPGDPAPLRLQGQVIRHAELEEGRTGLAVLFGDVPPHAATRIDLYLARQEQP